MRKTIVSNLLLIMFLVGAASGFFVSNVGWWGLQQGARDLDLMHESGRLVTHSLFEVESIVLRSQAILLDALNKQQISVPERSALRFADSDMRQHLDRLQQDPAYRAHWRQVRATYDRLAASRERVLERLDHDAGDAYRLYAAETMALDNHFLAALHLLQPQVADAAQQAYETGMKANRTARTMLLAMSVLSSIFFCLIAWLTCRETMARRLKTAQLDREHALFRTLFEGTGDGVILCRGEEFIDCNHATLALFGVPSVEQFRTLTPARLQPPAQPNGAPSEAGLAARMRDSIDHGSQRFEWYFAASDGTGFPAEVAIHSARLDDRDIIQLTIRDITERKQAERSMRLANQAFENSLEGMIITDGRGKILTVNRAFSTITGYALDEVVGKNPSVLSSGRQSREFYDEMWAAIDGQGKWQGEIWNIRKNGEIYPQWLNISRVTDEHGNVSNFVGVFSDISERKSAEERILRQVYYDRLTDLPNRVLFTDRLHQVMGSARRNPGKHFAVMFLDLDRFKLINDSMGHDAGDQLLQQAAHRLRGSMRETDTVARMGGDEFTVVLSEVGGPKDACLVAQKILDAFRAPFRLNDAEVYVAVSIGISVYPEDGSSAEVLLKNADMAMYRAKNAGGSWYELYEEHLGNQAGQRLSLETALHKAIERNELQLHYQPQFDCTTGKVLGFEALLRWRHPERGLLLPEAFLGIAEETGLIVPIGEWVLNTACAQAQQWRRDYPGHRLMAVNLSGRQFRSPELERQVAQALQRSDLPHFCLELDITESVVMDDAEASIGFMRRLADLGVQFSIGDFGTGNSSLAYLKRLPLHALKVGRSFIRNIATDPDDAAIVGAIISMAGKLGLRVVAEGIEDNAQLAVLKSYKGIIGQGYLLGRPVPADAATRMIAEGRTEAAYA